METLDRYPSYRLLSGVFVVVALLHIGIISGLQPLEFRQASSAVRRALVMNLQNTWKPPTPEPKQATDRKKTTTPPTTPKKMKPAAQTSEQRRPEEKPVQPIAPAPLTPPLEELASFVPDDPVQTEQKETKQPETIIDQPEEPLPITNASPRPEREPDSHSVPEPDLEAEQEIDPIEIAETKTKREIEKPPAPPAAVKQKINQPPDPPQVDWNGLVARFISRIDILDYYPTAARRRRQQGTVVVSITLSNTATIETVKIARSSRFSNLDNAALDLIRTNKSNLENLMKPYNSRIQQAIQLKLPIQFALR